MTEPSTTETAATGTTPAALPAPAAGTTPANRAGDTRAAWIASLHLAVWAYLMYGIGYATPYLRADLKLSDFESGLYASALAIGVLLAGASVDWVGRRIGPSLLQDVSVGVIIAGVLLVASGPVFPISLAGVFMLGLGGGTMGTQIVVQLALVAGGDSRKLMGQANALSMITAAAAPVVIGLAASGLHAWRLALLLPIAGYIALAIVRPREKFTRSQVRLPRQILPRAYWFAWGLIIMAVAIEFSIVYWGSTIVARTTGVSGGDATLLASLFVAGMFVGRAAIWRGLGGKQSPLLLMSIGLVIVLVGASLVWLSTAAALSALGLFLCGLGTSGLYPIGISVALAIAPHAQLEASARATFAAGLSVLLAPSMLGLCADIVGVVGAWPIIIGLAVVAMALLAVTPRPRENAA